MVDSTRAREHTWGVENLIREDERPACLVVFVDPGYYCLSLEIASPRELFISYIILRKEIRFNSHSRVVCNIPYTILNSIKFCRAAEFCVIIRFSDILTLDRFADHTILADSILYP